MGNVVFFKMNSTLFWSSDRLRNKKRQKNKTAPCVFKWTVHIDHSSATTERTHIKPEKEALDKVSATTMTMMLWLKTLDETADSKLYQFKLVRQTQREWILGYI